MARIHPLPRDRRQKTTRLFLLLACAAATLLSAPVAARATTTTDWTTATTIATGTVGNVHVATTTGGTTWVGWVQHDGADDRVHVRSVSADGVLGTDTPVSATGHDADQLSLAAEPAGGLTLAWIRSDGTALRVQVVHVSATGAVGAIASVSTAGEDAQTPQVAVQPNGTAWVAWRQQDVSQYDIDAAQFPQTAIPGSTITLSTGSSFPTEPRISVAVDNVVAVSWLLSGNGQARLASAEGPLGLAPVALGPTGEPPTVAAGATGSALVAWQVEGGPGGDVVDAERIGSDGLGGAPFQLSAAPGNFAQVRLAGAGDGHDFGAWAAQGATFAPAGRRIAPGDVLSGQASLGTSHDGVDQLVPALAADGSGVVAWHALDATIGSVHARSVAAGAGGSSIDGAGPESTLSTAGEDVTAVDAAAGSGAVVLGSVAWRDAAAGRVRLARLVRTTTPAPPTDGGGSGGGSGGGTGGGGSGTGGGGAPSPCPVGNTPGVQCTTLPGGGVAITGTAGADVIVGTPAGDVIDAGDGSDQVYGGTGDDVLDGGTGHDVVHGGAGDDLLSGGGGADVVDGGAGRDTLRGGDGNDALAGGVGNDRLVGGAGDDQLFGGAGQDHLWGEAGDDRLWGGAASDVLDGGSGRDTLRGEGAADTLHGGSGNDTFRGGAGRDLLLDLHAGDAWSLALDHVGDILRHGA